MLKIISRLAVAGSWAEYRACKTAAGKLDIVSQLSAVDSFIGARRRLEREIGGRP